MDLSVPYYEDFTRISNSNIGWFLNKGPAFLHKMLSGQGEEEKSAALTKGTMIHEYLLQPEEFQKDYVVWNKSRPASVQEEMFCQALADSIEIEPNKALLSAYKAAYSTSGKSEEKVLSEALKKASTLKDYIDFKKSGDKREMITNYQAIQLQKIKENISKHKAACKLLKPADNEKVFHEFHINWTYISYKDNNDVDFTCPCKSLLDSVTFDYDKKQVTLMDLKTTSHLHNFADAVNTYDYTRQLYYYTLALNWYIRNELHESPGDWKYRWYIIAIDSFTSEIRVFEFNGTQIYYEKNNPERICNALGDIVWHMENGLWEHSRAYYEGTGVETLTL
nr:MAG: protein of unknown function (DUF3799) [Bacteriophage sp.]